MQTVGLPTKPEGNVICNHADMWSVLGWLMVYNQYLSRDVLIQQKWRVAFKHQASKMGKTLSNIVQTNNDGGAMFGGDGYMYVCMYVCIYLSMYLCIYVSLYLCIFVFLCLCILVFLHLCIYVSLCVCMCVDVCLYVCMYACMHACMYLSICLSMCVSIYLSMYLWMSVCLSLCLEVCVCVSKKVLTFQG